MTFIWWLTAVLAALIFGGLFAQAINAYEKRTEAMQKRNLYARAAHLLGPDLAEKLGYTDLTKGEDDD